jgi:hypothetical protein
MPEQIKKTLKPQIVKIEPELKVDERKLTELNETIESLNEAIDR